MQKTFYCIALDINEGASRAVMNLRQNETKRQLIINLKQSGRPFFIDDDCRAVVAGTRPDGFKFFNDAQIRDGRAMYEVTELNSSAVGTAKANLMLYGPDGELIATPGFSFEITATAMGEGEILESVEATALTKLIREAETAIDEMETATGEAIAAMKATSITGAAVSVDNSVGKPSASVELSPGENGQTIKLFFANLKGEVGPAGKDGADGKDGAPGKDGTNGKDGSPGADGFSPTIDVSKSGDTTTLTITDKNGVKTAEIKDGSGADFSDEAAVEALIEVDVLPTITDASGAILTDINETIILRY